MLESIVLQPFPASPVESHEMPLMIFMNHYADVSPIQLIG
jgi:hypothetical protein